MKFKVITQILLDHSNLHGKYDSPCIFKELCFQCGYPEHIQTVKNRKKDPSFQILTSPEILYLARSRPMVLR